MAVQKPTRPSLTGTTHTGVETGSPFLRNVVNARYFSSSRAMSPTYGAGSSIPRTACPEASGSPLDRPSDRPGRDMTVR